MKKMLNSLNCLVKKLLPAFMIILFLPLNAFAGSNDNTPYRPASDSDKVYRVAYYEWDPYFNFVQTFHAILVGLNELGWLKNIDKMPSEYIEELDTLKMWEWLNANDTGKHIEFVKDGHYRLINEGDTERVQDRIRRKADIDLLIVMGTAPGRNIVFDDLKVPVMVFSTTNAVQSGIIASSEDSGNDFIWAHLEKNRHKQQLDVFYDLFQFKSLGIVFDNSETGRQLVPLDIIQKLSSEKGFKIEEVHVAENKTEKELDIYYQNLENAYRELSEKVDAVYITYGPKTPDRLRDLIKPFYDKKIPTFSQQGPEEVEAGVLLSVARSSFAGIGTFGAVNIGKLFNGARLRNLEQVHEETPNIVINIDTAKLINYHPPFDILLAADRIYRTKQKGEK